MKENVMLARMTSILSLAESYRASSGVSIGATGLNYAGVGTPLDGDPVVQLIWEEAYGAISETPKQTTRLVREAD